MSRSLFWLSDVAWAAIEPHLPKNQPGARRVDDRRVISGIVHMLKCGGRWQDCPSEYGPSTTVYNRWNRWSHRGIDSGSHDEHHHYISQGLIAAVDGNQVRLSASGASALLFEEEENGGALSDKNPD